MDSLSKSVLTGLGLVAAILVCAVAIGEVYHASVAGEAGMVSGSLVPPVTRIAATSADNRPSGTTFAAVEKAKEVGAACVPALSDLSKVVVDVGQDAVSTWHKESPGERAFVALNFLRYPDQAVAPRAVVVVEATPTKDNHCDAMDMRVQPSGLSCGEIASGLKSRRSPTPQILGDVALYPPIASGQRVILMPTATTGCVVITTGSYYGP